MKKYLLSFAVLGMLFAASTLTSCSDDDGDGGNLDTPKFEAEAAKYDITTPGARYNSIELTASGNYIVTSDQMNASYAPAANNAVERKSITSIFNNPQPKSRAAFAGIIYGKYTKVADNEYYLEGFGTIKITSNGGNSFDLDITTTNGNKVVLGANRDNMYGESEMTNKLCRTWEMNKISIKAWYNGRQIFNKTYSKSQFDNIVIDGEEIEIEEYPENVIFTKSGTYMVLYDDGTLAVSTWRWGNESKGVLNYSWDYNWDDPDLSGNVTLSFAGNQLYIYEIDEETEDGETYKTEFGYYLTEVK